MVCRPQGAALTPPSLPRGRGVAGHLSALRVTPGRGTGISSVPKTRCLQQPTRTSRRARNEKSEQQTGSSRSPPGEGQRHSDVK